MSEFIPSGKLESSDIPGEKSSWSEIATFALTFNGYKFHGNFETCSQVARGVDKKYRENGSFSGLSINALRTALFFYQRAIRHSETKPEMEYVSRILDAIRNSVKENENGQ